MVDDEPSITALCETLLRQAGFSVLVAHGSSEALKLCVQRKRPIDLLLTDLVLPPPGLQLVAPSNPFPHVHGHELAVRALRLRNNLRVICMSGNIDRDLAGYGIRRGNLPFIAKPFGSDALVALVRQTLQTQPPSAESIARLAEDIGISKVGDGWFG